MGPLSRVPGGLLAVAVLLAAAGCTTLRVNRFEDERAGLQAEIGRWLTDVAAINPLADAILAAYGGGNSAVADATRDFIGAMEDHTDALRELGGILEGSPRPAGEEDARQLSTLVAFAVEDTRGEAPCTIGRSVLILFLLERGDRDVAESLRALVDQQLCVDLTRIYADIVQLQSSLRSL